jgi:23S rRNA pseudouridine2604 synthase
MSTEGRHTEDSNSEGIRLAKRVSETVPCSRAEAERYIAGGWVSVDGAVVDDPATRVRDAQDVLLLPGARPVDPEPVTILLHKPAGLDIAGALALIGPDTLAQVQPGAPGSGARFLRRHLVKLQALLPLEPDGSGLAVFTQDWRITRRLTQDTERIEQEYVVEVAGKIADDGMAKLNASMRIGSRATLPVKTSWQSEARLRMAGKDMRMGQAQTMCAAVGLEVRGVRRLRIGRIALGALPLGQWRFLSEFERF